MPEKYHNKFQIISDAHFHVTTLSGCFHRFVPTLCMQYISGHENKEGTSLLSLTSLALCLKNETIDLKIACVLYLLSVMLWCIGNVLFSPLCVSLHMYVCVCLCVSNVCKMWQKSFSCIVKTSVFWCSSKSLILCVFNSMPLDRNTLPKKGLRYNTSAARYHSQLILFYSLM